MIASTPTRLRIHTEESHVPNSVAHLGISALEPLCEAIQRLTGCRLAFEAAAEPPTMHRWTTTIAASDSDIAGRLVLHMNSRLSDVKQQAVAQLVDSVGQLVSELLITHRALAHRESDLAVNFPIVAEAHSGNAVSLVEQFGDLLRGLCAGLGCQAAAIYTLDDATTVLRLRSSWGLPAIRLAHSARPLRGALADLEALAGHAVVIEDTSLLPHWKVPEPFSSAVCVPIAGPSMVLGTLWVFCDRVRDFTPEETQLIEIGAGRVAAELERPVLVHEVKQARDYERFHDRMLQWQEDRTLLVPPVIDGWEVAGAIANRFSVVRDFHLWRIAADGHLHVAAGGATGKDGATLLTTIGLQAALQAMMDHSSGPANILMDLNELAWSQSAGDQPASVFFAELDTRLGRLTYASAGTADAYVLRPHGWERLYTMSAMLGLEPDASYANDVTDIDDGDVLLIISDHDSVEPCEISSTGLAEFLLRHIDRSADELMRLAMSLIGLPSEPNRSPALLVVKRKELGDDRSN
jgi:GAF domain-containing protein